MEGSKADSEGTQSHHTGAHETKKASANGCPQHKGVRVLPVGLEKGTQLVEDVNSNRQTLRIKLNFAATKDRQRIRCIKESSLTEPEFK